MKRIAASLVEKSYSETVTCSFVKTRLLFAVLRSASLCLEGSRVKWRCGIGFDDGAATLTKVTFYHVFSNHLFIYFHDVY